MSLASMILKAAAKVAAKAPAARSSAAGVKTFTRTYAKGAKAGMTETVRRVAAPPPVAAKPLASKTKIRQPKPNKARAERDSRLYSTHTGFDPKPHAQRPFYADYPKAAAGHEPVVPFATPEGVRLDAPFVAGRRGAGAGDDGIRPEALRSISEALVGAPPVPKGSAELGRGTVGWFRVRGGAEATQYEVAYLSTLDPAATARTVAHELGHAIDHFARGIPTKGIKKELEQVYSDLATGRFGKTTNRTLPEHFGYKGDQVDKELIAEAVKAYMVDPNYLKTVAPKTAKAIREAVNKNPKIAKVIQFNSLAALGLLGGGVLANPGRGGGDKA